MIGIVISLQDVPAQGKQKRYRQVSCHELVGIATTDPDDLGDVRQCRKTPPQKIDHVARSIGSI